MKLVTYMDDGKLRTLMVDWLLDSYHTSSDWMVEYGVGDHTIEIPADDIVAEYEIRTHQFDPSS